MTLNCANLTDDNVESCLSHVYKLITLEQPSGPYFDFIKDRQYYTENKNDLNAILKTYKYNVQMGIDKGYNDLVDKKNNNLIRIMTWNVRYFTDYNNKPTIEKIANVINDINPDIVCLQEATVGYSSKYYKVGTKKAIDIRLHLKNYELITSCNVVPSWYHVPYGNMIFMKKSLIEFVQHINNLAFDYLCDPNKKRCSFNQYATTFRHPAPEKAYVAGSSFNIFKNRETRCFVKISFSGFDIFCTHLEAYNKTLRKQQLDELRSHISRPSIILGDFNIIDTQMYERWRSYFKNNDDTIFQNMTKEYNYIRRFNKLGNDDEVKYIRDDLGWIDAFDFNRSSSKTILHTIYDWEDKERARKLLQPQPKFFTKN